MNHPIESNERTLGLLISRLLQGLGDLAELHVSLAKAAVSRDAQALRADALPIAAGLPLVGIGYLLLCVALAAALAPLAGIAGALALVGGANLLGGGLAVRTGMDRLRKRRLLEETAHVVGPELQKSLRSLVRTPFPTEVADAP